MDVNEYSTNNSCLDETSGQPPSETNEASTDTITDNNADKYSRPSPDSGTQGAESSGKESSNFEENSDFYNTTLPGVVSNGPVERESVHQGNTKETEESSGPPQYEFNEERGYADDSAARSKVEVKLFVGRLPRSIDEATLASMFTPFGGVVETVVIRDKITGQHKGSGFVKMVSITEADAAIRALHNIKIVDPQSGPILVKYANGEPERLGLASTDSAQPGTDLGKLFVGSLGRFATEADVRRLFEPYGTIEEVILMKDQVTNMSRGCAFVKFTYKESAINAIKALHGVVVTPGSTRPLEVKFAESRRIPSLVPQAGSRAQTSPVMAYSEGPGMMMHAWRVPKNMAAPSNLNPRSAAGWTEYFTADNRPYYHNEATGLTQWAKPPEFDRFFMTYGNSRGSVMGGRCGGLLVPPGNAVSSMASNPVSATGATTQHTDVAGPPGANVFVFHIPNEWTQNDVAAHFSPFGPVISCYIATDKTTGRNKGYGFVSFDNIHSAAKAVMGMNGYLVGSKRLKVSIKTGEERYVSHLMGPGATALLNTSHQMVSHATAPQHAAALPSHGLEPMPHLRNYNQTAVYHHHMGGHPTFGPAMSSANNVLGSYRASPY